MFSLHDFVLDTILKMVGNTADYKVQRYALGWYEKEVLTDEDMILIAKKIDEKNAPVVEELPTEEITEETTVTENATESEVV